MQDLILARDEARRRLIVAFCNSRRALILLSRATTTSNAEYRLAGLVNSQWVLDRVCDGGGNTWQALPSNHYRQCSVCNVCRQIPKMMEKFSCKDGMILSNPFFFSNWTTQIGSWEDLSHLTCKYRSITAYSQGCQSKTQEQINESDFESSVRQMSAALDFAIQSCTAPLGRRAVFGGSVSKLLHANKTHDLAGKERQREDKNKRHALELRIALNKVGEDKGSSHNTDTARNEGYRGLPALIGGRHGFWAQNGPRHRSTKGVGALLLSKGKAETSSPAEAEPSSPTASSSEWDPSSDHNDAADVRPSPSSPSAEAGVQTIREQIQEDSDKEDILLWGSCTQLCQVVDRLIRLLAKATDAVTPPEHSAAASLAIQHVLEHGFPFSPLYCLPFLTNKDQGSQHPLNNVSTHNICEYLVCFFSD